MNSYIRTVSRHYLHRIPALQIHILSPTFTILQAQTLSPMSSTSKLVAMMVTSSPSPMMTVIVINPNLPHAQTLGNFCSRNFCRWTSEKQDFIYRRAFSPKWMSAEYFSEAVMSRNQRAIDDDWLTIIKPWWLCSTTAQKWHFRTHKREKGRYLSDICGEGGCPYIRWRRIMGMKSSVLFGWRQIC